MFKRISFLSVAMLILLVSRLFAAQIDITWDGGGDGISWYDADNWNPDIIPDNDGGNTFAVTINADYDYIDVELGMDFDCTIDQLDCFSDDYEIDISNETPDFAKLTLTDQNGLTNYGALEIEGARGMTIVGNVTNSAGSEIEFWGIIDIDNGNLRNFSNGTIQIGGDDLGVSDGDLDNFGTVIIDPESEFGVETLNNSGLIYIRGGQCETDSVFDNNSTGVIQGHGDICSDQIILNKGCIIASAGSLTITGDESIINTGLLRNNPVSSLYIQPAKDVNNMGTIETNAGGGVVFDCNLINEANGVIKILGGALGAVNITQKAGAVFEGDGKISGNLLIQTNAHVALTGPTEIYGDVQIDTNAVLDINDGTALIKGHCTCNSGTIHLRGGRLIPQGGLTNNNCNIIWEPGLYTNIADFNLDGKVDFKDFANFADIWLWQASW